jgi:hypothetical protein
MILRGAHTPAAHSSGAIKNGNKAELKSKQGENEKRN